MKRAVAYCRISTDKDDQLNSLENQKSYFEKYIKNNLDLEFAGIYSDDGVSGTSTKNRSGFNAMFEDAKRGKFDIVLTKEISRFARNTLDSVYYTRELKALGIGVFFINDNINTLDPDSELRLTIMSSIAQEESRKTSDRVRWGQKRQMEKGVVFGNGVYGYNLEKGKLTINEEQANIIRLIFSLYLNEGAGTYLICKELENRGIPSPSGAVKWKNASLLRILKNEKYIGVLKQKKSVTLDYLSHKKVVNDGREDYIIIEDNHEPIIEREVFSEVQNEIIRRRTTTMDKSKHSNRYAWSGKLECALCGSKMVKKVWNRKSDNPTIVWECGEKRKNGVPKTNAQGKEIGCACKAAYQSFLEEAFMFALNSVAVNKAPIIGELKTDIEKILSAQTDNSVSANKINSKIEKIKKRKIRTLEIYADGSITREEFDAANQKFNRDIETLELSLADFAEEAKKSADLKNRLNEINRALENIAGLETYSDEVCACVLEKVVVHSRDFVEIYLAGKAGTGENIFIPVSITPFLPARARSKSSCGKARLR